MASAYFYVKLLQTAAASRKSTHRTASGQHNINKTRPKARESERYRCRVCLQPGSIPIFGQHIDDITLYASIRIICCIEVTAGDGDPQHLCQSCFNTLIAAVKLRDTATKSQIVLKKMKTLELDKAVKLKEIKTVKKQPKSKEKSTNDTKQQSASDSFQVAESEMECDLEASMDTAEQKDNNESTNSPQEPDLDVDDHFLTIITTENEAVFKCRTCNKLLKAASAAAHILEHLPEDESLTKELPEEPTEYVCEVCGKSFKKSMLLKRHQEIHSNDLPYKCDLCPYRGRNKTYLYNHSKTHGMKNPHKCPRCPKTFLSRSNLNHHMRRYADPSFACSFCDKSFYDNFALTRHFRDQHMGIVETHKCTICGNIYKNRKNLLKHEIKAHKRKLLRKNQAVYLKLEGGSDTNEPKTSK